MQNDLQQFEINDMTPEESPPPRKKFGPPSPRLWRVNKKHFIIFGSIFLAVLVLVGGGYYVWENYLSPSARSARQAEVNYQKYLDWQKNYEAAMTADTYGGKTPQETLDLFVDALKKGDTELANKYFILREDGTRDPKWIEALNKTKESGLLDQTINILEKSAPDISNITTSTDYKFKSYTNNELKAYVNMELNKFSGTWKIESM